MGLIERLGMAGGRLAHRSWPRPVEMTDVAEDWSCNLK